MIGITGTREGMTPAQIKAFISALRWFGSWQMVHGDCVGADRDAWAIAEALGLETVAYPSTADPQWHANTPSDTRHERRPSLDRNRAIVDDCDVLYAFPKDMTEAASGGTWYTIRYARKVGRHLFIFWPDGSVSEENAA